MTWVEWLVVSVFVATVVWRVILPSMRLERGDRSSDTPTYGDIGQWFKDHKRALTVIGIAIGGLLGLLFVVWAAMKIYGALSPLWNKPPTLVQVWSVTKEYWFWIFLVSGLLYLIGSAIPKVAPADGKGKKEKRQACTVLHGLAYAGVITFLAIALAWSIFGGGYVHPAVGAAKEAAARYSGPPEITWPKEAWPTVTLPANGTSPMLSVPPKKRIFVEGKHFSFIVLYAGGHECASGCGDEAIIGLRIVNTADIPNTVSYAFGPA